jgi:hypothetical protein
MQTRQKALAISEIPWLSPLWSDACTIDNQICEWFASSSMKFVSQRVPSRPEHVSGPSGSQRCKDVFQYDAATDSYVCPAGARWSPPSYYVNGKTCRQSFFILTTIQPLALASSSALSSCPIDGLRS